MNLTQVTTPHLQMQRSANPVQGLRMQPALTGSFKDAAGQPAKATVKIAHTHVYCMKQYSTPVCIALTRQATLCKGLVKKGGGR